MCDNVPVMSLLARLLLAVLAICIASLAPILPGQAFPVAQQQKSCCPDMTANGSHYCPINTGAANSLAGSTCCTGLAGCLPLYLNNGHRFGAQMHIIGTISDSADRVTTRSNRPPVPPPRAQFS
jgi:hypothetical protein